MESNRDALKQLLTPYNVADIIFHDDGGDRIETLVLGLVRCYQDLKQSDPSARKDVNLTRRNLRAQWSSAPGHQDMLETFLQVLMDEEFLATLDHTSGSILIIDPQEVAQAIQSARRAMDSIDSRLSDKQLGKTIDELHTALTGLSAILQNTDLVVRAGREDFVATLKYIRQAAEDLREFSRIIAQNPSALLSGRE